jgi:hypothetical protein
MAACSADRRWDGGDDSDSVGRVGPVVPVLAVMSTAAGKRARGLRFVSPGSDRDAESTSEIDREERAVSRTSSGARQPAFVIRRR